MSDVVAERKKEAAESGYKVLGVDMSGKISSYDEQKTKRENLMRNRESKGITRNKTSEHGQGWL